MLGRDGMGDGSYFTIRLRRDRNCVSIDSIMPRGKSSQSAERAPVPRGDVEARIHQLAKDYRIYVPPEPKEITELKSLWGRLTDAHISEKLAFTQQVNRLMRDAHYRFELPDGTLALLQYQKEQPRSPGEKILYRASGEGKPGGASSGRLGKVSVKFVPVIASHASRSGPTMWIRVCGLSDVSHS